MVTVIDLELSHKLVRELVIVPFGIIRLASQFCFRDVTLAKDMENKTRRELLEGFITLHLIQQVPNA